MTSLFCVSVRWHTCILTLIIIYLYFYQVLPAGEMREHMLMVHVDNSTQEFVCPRQECGQAFPAIPQLRLHLAKEHEQSEVALSVSTKLPKVYACSDCDTVSQPWLLLWDFRVWVLWGFWRKMQWKPWVYFIGEGGSGYVGICVFNYVVFILLKWWDL